MRKRYRIKQEITIGDLVEGARIHREMSVASLSELSGVSKTTIRRLEHGNTSVRFSKVVAILAVLGVNINLIHKEEIGRFGRKPVRLIREK